MKDIKESLYINIVIEAFANKMVLPVQKTIITYKTLEQIHFYVTSGPKADAKR